MAKVRGNTDSNDVDSGGRSIRKLIGERINASGRLVLGFTLFYAGWLLTAYAVDVFVASPAVSVLAAVMFWFGIVFAVFTLALGILLTVLNTISRMRR